MNPAFNFQTAIVLTGSQTWSSPGTRNAGLDFYAPINLGTNTLTIGPSGSGSSGLYAREKITGSGGLIVHGSLFFYRRDTITLEGLRSSPEAIWLGTFASLQGNFSVAPTGMLSFGDVLDGSEINGTFHGTISGGGTVNIEGRR